ncbi:MAG: class I SAM-dependent methyltransferase [Promethearchaeota archaeon]
MPFNFKNPSKLFAWFYSLFCPIYGRKFYKELLPALKLNGKESILDFGSGAGVLAKKIVKELSNGGTLTCLDLSEAFLNKVRKKLINYTNVKFILGDIRKLSIASNTFDKIVITWVIHHIPEEDRLELLKSLVHTLKKDGKIFVIEYLAVPHGISEKNLTEIFSEIGFSGRLEYREKNTGIFRFTKN